MPDRTISLNAYLDEAQRAELERAVATVKNGQAVATSRAVNKVLPGMRQEMISAVRQIVPLKASVVRAATGYFRATVARPSGKVWTQGRPIALSYFSPQPRTAFPYTRRGRAQRPPVGVSVILDLRRGAVVVPGSFMVERATAWSKSLGTGNAYEVVKRLGHARSPIRILQGPAPGDLLEQDRAAVARLEAEAQRRLAERLEHETWFLYSQAFGGGK